MSHHCHDEHVGGGGDDHHDHHHDHAGHDHSDDITPALQFSLYQHIDFDKIVTLNESRSGSGRDVVKKTWDERLAEAPELESDCDEQLLITVPFTGQVKLHAILLRTSPAATAPRTLHVFQNRDMDFGEAEEAAEGGGGGGGGGSHDKSKQTFELSQTSDVQELQVKRAHFGQVRKLTLFFPDNFSDGEEAVTRLSYLGFRGEWMQLGRAPVNILYESAANPSDHALKGTSINRLGSNIGGQGRGPGS